MKATTGRRGRGIALLLAACLIMAVVYGALAATESVTVYIPVSATGAACTALLTGSGVNMTQTLTPGSSATFTLTVNGLGRFEYTLRLTDADTAMIDYDDTVFTVDVDTYWADATTLAYVLSANHGAGTPKVAEIRFDNSINTPVVTPDNPPTAPALTPSATPRPTPTETPAPTATVPPTASPVPTASPTPVPAVTATPSPEPTVTPTPDPNATPAPTPYFEVDRERPTPQPGATEPPHRGPVVEEIEDYNVPLGLGAVINHVGDTFD